MIHSVASNDSGSREERWYVMAVHPIDEPGRRQRILRAVDAEGNTMATVGFEGDEMSERAEMVVEIATDTQPELVAQLVGRLSEVAVEAGVETLTVDLEGRRSMVAEVLVRSGLAWRLRSADGSTRAELTLAQTAAGRERVTSLVDTLQRPTDRDGVPRTSGGSAGGRRRTAVRWRGAGHGPAAWTSGFEAIGEPA